MQNRSLNSHNIHLPIRYSPLHRPPINTHFLNIILPIQSGQTDGSLLLCKVIARFRPVGMNKNTQIAKITAGQPSIKKRILHCGIALLVIFDTPKAISPPKAPDTVPAATNNPTRLARSRLVYQNERYKTVAWPDMDSPIPTKRRQT